MKIPWAELVAVIEAAGFRLVEDDPKLLPDQTFLTFEKPATRAVGNARNAGAKIGAEPR